MGSDRRTFLKTLAATVGGHGAAMAGLSPVLLGMYRAMADASADPGMNFVMFRVHGSMDSTLGLHPYSRSNAGIADQDLFLGYDPLKDVITEGAVNLGPAAEGIRKFANQMAIVRGIYVGPNDLGHPFAIQHMTSGRTQESAPSWTSYFGDQYARDGYVVTNTALLRGTLAPFPTLLTNVVRAQISAFTAAKKTSGLSLYKDKNLGVNKYLDFLKQTDKLGKFMEIYEPLSKKDGTEVKVTDADIVLASLYSGISRVAQIDIQAIDGRISLDTHTAHAENHKRAQVQRWDMIGGFLSRLQETGLLDKTLVAVVTEFNRTPGLNDNGGKDHNYSDNAVALFGRGVRGGTVIGDRKLWTRADGFPYAYWAGSHMDFESGYTIDLRPGQTAPNGVGLIHPGDVWKTVARSFSDKMVSQAAESDFFLPRIF